MPLIGAGQTTGSTGGFDCVYTDLGQNLLKYEPNIAKTPIEVYNKLYINF